MPVLMYSEFVRLARKFCMLQSELQDEFFKQNSTAKDWKYLTDLPRHGHINTSQEEWAYTRHGLGVRFEGKMGAVVDIHNFFLKKGAIDPHRIHEYLLSKKKNIDDNVDVYRECEEAIKNMEMNGVIKKAGVAAGIWTLV